jgi:hypothetical protein
MVIAKDHNMKAVKFSLFHAITKEQIPEVTNMYALWVINIVRLILRLQQPLFIQFKNPSTGFVYFTTCNEKKHLKIKGILLHSM